MIQKSFNLENIAEHKESELSRDVSGDVSIDVNSTKNNSVKNNSITNSSLDIVKRPQNAIGCTTQKINAASNANNTPKNRKHSLFSYDAVKNYSRNSVLQSILLISIGINSLSAIQQPDIKIPSYNTIAYIDRTRVDISKKVNLGIVKKNLSNPSFISDSSATIEDLVKYYAKKDNFTFRDNKFYDSLRVKLAINKLSNYQVDNGEYVFVIDKTFQKNLLFKVVDKYTPISIDSISHLKDSDLQSFYLFYKGLFVMKKDRNYKLISEKDCSTGKNHGSKKIVGDAKTPEGFFRVYDLQSSKDWIFEGKKVYGSHFARIDGSIGIHGNGTYIDSSNTYSRSSRKNKGNRTDNSYSEGEELGIFENNFGEGKSHGCIRNDNVDLKRYIEQEYLRIGTPIIVYEDSSITNLMRKFYIRECDNKRVLASKVDTSEMTSSKTDSSYLNKKNSASIAYNFGKRELYDTSQTNNYQTRRRTK